MVRYLSLFFILSVTIKGLYGQASHNSGFYSVDSLYWNYTHQGHVNDTVLIAINTFSDDGFVPYSGGTWLLNRNYTSNTWENQQFSKSPLPSAINIDTSALRGMLRKVNVVRIRIKPDNHAEGVSDEVYFIGINGTTSYIPHTMPVVHLFVDSMASFGPEGFYGPGDGIYIPALPPYAPADFFWNYAIPIGNPRVSNIVSRERVEKPGYVQILNTDGTSLLNKKIGVRITGSSSVHRVNKSMQVIARDIYSPQRMNTALFGEIDRYKALRFRSGGSSQHDNLGNNEIGLSVINGLKMGEVKNRIVVVYLNGSYWSMAYAQQKVDEYLPASYTGTDKDSIGLFEPIPFVPITLQAFSDTNLLQVIDTSTLGLVQSLVSSNPNDKLASFITQTGDRRVLENLLDIILALNTDTNKLNQFVVLDSLIDVVSWLRYIAVVDYLKLNDAIGNNVYVVTDPNVKPYLLAKDFDYIAGGLPNDNFWQQYILNGNINDDFIRYIVRNIFLQNPYCVNELLRCYQDLLNTTFLPHRTTGIINEIYSDLFFNEFPEHYQSWGGWPNGGYLNSADYTAKKQAYINFFNQRHSSAWQICADQWMPDDNMSLSDRNSVKVILDSIPAGLAEVQLNSLTLDSTWSGLYFPKPTVKVKLNIKGNIPNGYSLIWKEYTDSTNTLQLSATNAITLTPVLRPLVTGIGNHNSTVAFSVFPNPANHSFSFSHTVKYELWNQAGKLVAKGTGNSVDVSEITAGAYILKCTASSFTHSQKVEVVH